MNTGPTTEQRCAAFNRGYKDFFKGNPKNDHFYAENPYRNGTDDNKEWEAGFNAAYFRNLEFFKARKYPSYSRNKNVVRKAA